MIVHAVMFYIKNQETIHQKKEALQTVKQQLMSLKQHINCLKDCHVGINEKESSRSADLLLMTYFHSWKDLDIYRDHVYHQQVLADIKPFIEKSIVVDYTHSNT